MYKVKIYSGTDNFQTTSRQFVIHNLTTTVNTKASQSDLNTTIGNLTNLTNQVNSQQSMEAQLVQIPEHISYLGLNANGNGESLYHNGHRLAAQSFLVGKDKFQETQPEDSFYRYIGYIDLLNAVSYTHLTLPTILLV